MQAVADRQALAGLLAGGDHGIAFGDGGRHRLLADDVLAGTEGGDDVLGMDAGRRDHVDHVDRLVRGDLLPLVVRVDVGVGEAVELGELLTLGARAGDRGHELHVLGLEQRGRQLAVRVTTQTAQGEPERLAAGFGRAQGGGEGIAGGEAAEGGEERTTGGAHGVDSF